VPIQATGGEAFFDDEFVPLAEANVSIATHALNYGTGCFEGIRAYWNEDRDQLYVLKMKEHYERLAQSARILGLELNYSVGELCEITLELLRRNEYRQNTYIRPLLFKSDPEISLMLSGIETMFAMFCVPMGDYLDTSQGLKCGVSSWARLNDNALPARAKATGAYINACLASEEARKTGFDEAIVLTGDGHVSEGASANMFMVRDGVLITSPVSDSILEGVTRAAIMELAEEEVGVPVNVRSIDRTELYIADELFYCGTGVQVAPITSVDHRPVGDGKPGELTTKLQNIYFEAAVGDNPQYSDWVEAVYEE
jgi:branched-chain amino acid aminotransferase